MTINQRVTIRLDDGSEGTVEGPQLLTGQILSVGPNDRLLAMVKTGSLRSDERARLMETLTRFFGKPVLVINANDLEFLTIRYESGEPSNGPQ